MIMKIISIDRSIVAHSSTNITKSKKNSFSTTLSNIFTYRIHFASLNLSHIVLREAKLYNYGNCLRILEIFVSVMLMLDLVCSILGYFSTGAMTANLVSLYPVTFSKFYIVNTSNLSNMSK